MESKVEVSTAPVARGGLSGAVPFLRPLSKGGGPETIRTRSRATPCGFAHGNLSSNQADRPSRQTTDRAERV